MPGTTTKTTELYVTAPNEVGTYAKIAHFFKQSNINIWCSCGYTEGNNAVFHFVTNNNATAKDVMTKAGYTVSEKPAVWWTTNNTTGEAYRATAALAETGVNIDYCYQTSAPDCNTTGIVFVTNDYEKTFNTLNNL